MHFLYRTEEREKAAAQLIIPQVDCRPFGQTVFHFIALVGILNFTTLTEIPILQELMSNGMGQGPTLVLLLADPVVLLPNLLDIKGLIGTQKTIVFFILVVIMATMSGFLFGAII